MAKPPLSLAEDAIRERWNDADIERAILHDLPRRFHALPPHEQAEVLASPPPLTGTRWDGALPDPRDLDARGGEHHAWVP